MQTLKFCLVPLPLRKQYSAYKYGAVLMFSHDPSIFLTSCILILLKKHMLTNSIVFQRIMIYKPAIFQL